MLRAALTITCFCTMLLCIACSSEVDSVQPPAPPDDDAEPQPLVLPVAGVTPYDCEPGDIEGDDGSCTPPGVIACGVGFEPDGDGGCRAILPNVPCAPGEMALPGETSCRPVAPCGSGRWGDIPTDSTTLFVDQAYSAGNNDGSQLAPFVTIGEAVAVAAPGDLIAVAAGNYAAQLIDTPVRLWGVCPELVHIDAAVDDLFALELGATASGSELHDLSVSGGTLVTIEARLGDLSIDRVHVSRAVRGARGGAGTSLEVRRSLFEDFRRAIETFGATVVIEDTVIRDSIRDVGALGVAVGYSTTASVGANLTVRRSIIDNVATRGLYVWDSDAIVEDSLIRDVRSAVGDSAAVSCAVLFRWGTDQPVSARLSGSVLEGCDEVALHLEGRIDVALDNLTLRAANNEQRQAALAVAKFAYGGSPNVTLRHAALVGAPGLGWQQGGGSLEAEGVVIKDIVAGPYGGTALMFFKSPVLERPHLGGNGLLITRSVGAGIVAEAADVALHSLLIDSIAPHADGRHGRGIELRQARDAPIGSVADLSRVYIRDVHDAGIAVLGSELMLSDSEIAGVETTTDGILGQGLVFQDGALPAGGAVRDTTIRDAHAMGLYVLQASSTTLLAERLLVERTMDTALGFGDGIFVLRSVAPAEEPALRLVDSISRDNARGGIVSLGATIALGGNAMLCNVLQLTGESYSGFDFELADDGSNVCSCGDVVEACRVLSSEVRPPDPLDVVPTGKASGGI